MRQHVLVRASARLRRRDLVRAAGRVLAIACVSLIVSVRAEAATLVVDDDGMAIVGNCNDTAMTYMSISAAVAAANPNDTIKVCPGLYVEQVMITKTLTLLGAQFNVDATTRPFVPANESIIDHPCGPVQIEADKVVLNGFTIQGSTLQSDRARLRRNAQLGLVSRVDHLLPTIQTLLLSQVRAT